MKSFFVLNFGVLKKKDTKIDTFGLDRPDHFALILQESHTPKFVSHILATLH